jgi:hypothetical protein
LFSDQLSSILDDALVGVVGSLWMHWRFLCYQKPEKGKKRRRSALMESTPKINF